MFPVRPDTELGLREERGGAIERRDVLAKLLFGVHQNLKPSHFFSRPSFRGRMSLLTQDNAPEGCYQPASLCC